LSSEFPEARRYKRLASNIFGVLMLALALLVTAETLLRKLFSISLGGVDELAGYSITIGAPLAFAVCLIDRSHIRINLLYIFMRPRLKAWMDCLSVFAIGLVAIFLFAFAVKTVMDTQTYQSLAQTPWATPLIYPQSLWLIAVSVFVLPAVLLPLRAMLMLSRGQHAALSSQFGPDTPQDELKAELEDLKRR